MRRSPKNVRIAFNHAGLTHFGGIHLLHEFTRVLHFRDFLAQQIRYSRRNRRYSVPQMLMALVYPIVLGLDRIETASLLRANGTFQYLTGLPSFPDPQTLRPVLAERACSSPGAVTPCQRSSATKVHPLARTSLASTFRSGQHSGDILRSSGRR